jgi:hypothetical protein
MGRKEPLHLRAEVVDRFDFVVSEYGFAGRSRS